MDTKDKLVAGALARLMQPAPKAPPVMPKVDDPIKPASPPMVLGSVITWCSPLFGNLEGHVLMSDGDTILVNHPIIGEPAWICRSGIIEKGEDCESHHES